mmetsp:Transcript_12933/g.30430  ORF Transcript_12933/g.30430 Transcript_12933/m.30430 type:complete len:371 (-) Transcript_12933:322-1434(-)
MSDSPRSPRSSSPRDEASYVSAQAGPRPPGVPAAEARRPLVPHSFVPSDIEAPRYGLPSSDYIKRYKQAHVLAQPTQTTEANGAGEPRRPRIKKLKRRGWIAVGLFVCVLGGLAVLALMSMASLAVYQCAPRNSIFTHEPGAAGLDAPCVAVPSNDNGECTAPGVWGPYVNRTGGECCMPAGFVCGIDTKVTEACGRGTARVGKWIGQGPGERMCCHPEGLSASALTLLKLSSELKALQDQATDHIQHGFHAEDLDTVSTQLDALTASLTAALEELPRTIELVTTAKALAIGAITKREADEAAAAERAKQEALRNAREIRAAEEAVIAAKAARREAELAAIAAAAAKRQADRDAAVAANATTTNGTTATP